MTFFYNLNKKLQEVANSPKSVHQQLHERANKSVGEGIEDRIGDLDMSNPVNVPAYQRKAASGDSAAAAKGFPTKEGVDKQKFAALAPPKDKITFADKIAGAKKEVDEMLGDVAAEAMKAALGKGKKVVADEGSTGDYSAKKARAGKDIGKPGKNFGKIAKGAAERYGSEAAGKRVAGAVLNKLRHPQAEVEEGWDDMMKDVERRRSATKKGEITHGHKHDIENTGTGRRVTRRTDPNTGYSVGADADDKPADGEKRGRGRPKKADKAPERVTANATKHKGGRKVKEGDFGPMEEGEGEGSDLVKLSKVIASCTTKEQLETARKMAQNFLKKHASRDEIGFAGFGKDVRRRNDVVSTISQKNKELGNVEETKLSSSEKEEREDIVKGMKKNKGDFKKRYGKRGEEVMYATATKMAKERGPGNPDRKKKEKTEEAGGKGTPTASSGFSFGQGIYDSFNRDLEEMISESMNISMSSNSDGADGAPTKSLTVTATDEDASYLAQILKSAGLGRGEEGGCGCGTTPCSCGSEEVVDENKPDWPTNQETSNDALQYSGGLNKPKSTGQTTVPVIASQEERQGTYADEEQDAIKRMMEMAGVKEAKKPDFPDVDKDGNEKETLEKALKDKEEKAVKESILDLSHLWKTYKG